jgi:tetratricopeptide (TPR) repeat protein
VALVHKYIGGHLLEHGHAEQALPHLQRAADLDEARVAGNPGDHQARLDLSFDYSQFGGYYEATGNLPKAIEYTRRMARIRRELAASDPRNAWMQNRLAWAVGRIGDLQLKVSDARGALASYQESKTLGKNLVGPEVRRMEAVARADVGIGAVRLKMGDREASCAAYVEARDMYRTLAAKAPLANSEADHRDQAEKAAAQCSAAER